jgi:hypothetical protein
MAHTEHDAPRARGTARLNHEPTDAPLGSVERIIVAGIIVLAVSFGLMWLLLGMFRAQAERTETRPTPPAQAARAADTREPLQRFPMPRLQEVPALDIGYFKQTQDRTLHTYGWEDKTRGVVRIPIERAIEILAERGLDGVAAPATAPAGTSAAPAGAAAGTPAGGAAASAPGAAGGNQ